MRTLRSACPYVNKLMSNADILVLSEHRLYSSELYKLDDLNCEYEFHGKASHDLKDEMLLRKPGHCGIAIGWKKSISDRIRVIQSTSDRLCIIEIIGAISGINLYVIGVYLPQQACKISDFDEHLLKLDHHLTELQEKGRCIVMALIVIIPILLFFAYILTFLQISS